MTIKNLAESDGEGDKKSEYAVQRPEGHDKGKICTKLIPLPLSETTFPLNNLSNKNFWNTTDFQVQGYTATDF